MKKIISLIFGLWSATLFSQGVNTLTPAATTPTHNSCQLTVELNGASGTSYKLVLVYHKYPFTDTMTRGDSTVVTGLGFGNLRNVNMYLSGLIPGTSYRCGTKLYNSSGTTLLAVSDTTVSFNTQSSPGSGTMSSITTQPVVGGARIIIQSNNSNITSVLSVKGRLASYSGSDYPITTTPTIKTNTASYNTSTDTFYMYSNELTYLRITLTPTNGSAGAVNTSYSFTPLTATRPKVNAIYSTPQYDSFTASASVTLGNVGGYKIFLRRLDTFGNIVSSSIPQDAVSGMNHFYGNSWSLNTSYGLEAVIYDSIGNRDSFRISNGWRTKIAPIVSQSLVNSSLKASTAWFDIKFITNEYHCPVGNKRTWRLEKVSTSEIVYYDTLGDINTNNLTRRVNLVGLIPSTNYRLISTAINCTGVVSEYPYSFTTPAGLAAPTVSPLTGYGGCAEVGINSFSVIPQSGDTAVVYWVIKNPSWTVWEIYDSVIITKSSNLPGFSITIPASTTVDLGVQTRSKDGVLSSVSPVRVTSLPSGNGSVNRELISADTASATFDVFGNLDCSDSATVRCKIWKGTDLVTQRDIRVGRGTNNSGNFSLTNVNFTGLAPNTEYHMEVGIFISQWIGLQSGGDRYFTTKSKNSSSGGGGTSGITSGGQTTIWDTDPIVTVYDLSGRTVTIEKTSKISFLKNQVLILKTETGETKKVIVQP